MALKSWSKTHWAVFIAYLSVFIAGFVPSAQASDESEGGGTPEVPSESSTETPIALSGPEMLIWVDEQLVTARGAMGAVQKLTQQAGKEKDTIKITCLDDKLMQMNLSIGGVEERTEALRVAVSAGDIDSARQNFEILKIYFTRILGLGGEAENCLGESDVVLGKTETTMLISGDVTAEDPSGEDIANDVGVEQPPQISGYY